MILYRSLWEALDEVPVKSSRCPYMMSYFLQVLLRRPCGDPVKSSSRGPCIKLSKMLCRLCIGACMKVLLAWSRCDDVQPHLLLFHIAAVACIWHIDFPPPTLFGVSCRCNEWPSCWEFRNHWAIGMSWPVWAIQERGRRIGMQARCENRNGSWMIMAYHIMVVTCCCHVSFSHEMARNRCVWLVWRLDNYIIFATYFMGIQLPSHQVQPFLIYCSAQITATPAEVTRLVREN